MYQTFTGSGTDNGHRAMLESQNTSTSYPMYHKITRMENDNGADADLEGTNLYPSPFALICYAKTCIGANRLLH